MIVGLYSSVPQSGKSTVARTFLLAGFYGYSLADPVKKTLQTFLTEAGVQNPHQYLWGGKKDEVIPEIGVTGGFLMSTFASDYIRNTVNENIWLDILLKKTTDPNKNYIVDDMRFPNEYDAVDVRVRVLRAGVRVEHGRSVISEGQLDDKLFDYLIYNNGSEARLIEKTEDIIRLIRGDKLYG